MQPARSSYGQPIAVKGIEQIICPSFAEREFETDEQANEYARQVFGSQAFAVVDNDQIQL